jgi:hypothetical protein
MLHRMVRVLVALCAGTLVLGGCASVEEVAAARLQEQLDALHANVLESRAQDPALTGEAVVSGITDSPLHSSVDGDTVTVVLTLQADVERGGGLFYESASRGACVLVWIRAGDEEGDHGEVATGPVPCPSEIPDDRVPSELTTDLEPHWDDVGEPEPHYEPCYSGEVCDHGGG